MSNKFFFISKLVWSIFGDVMTEEMAWRGLIAAYYFLARARFDGRLAFIISIINLIR